MTYDQTMVVAWVVLMAGIFIGSTLIFEALMKFIASKIGYASTIGSLLTVMLLVNLKW